MIRDIPDEVSPTAGGGRTTILNALTEQLTRRAGNLSQAATSTNNPASREAACAAAEAAFAATLETYPLTRNRTPQRCIDTCRGIWELHGEQGFFHRRIERALKETRDPMIIEFLKTQLNTAAPPRDPKTPDSDSK